MKAKAHTDKFFHSTGCKGNRNLRKWPRGPHKMGTYSRKGHRGEADPACYPQVKDIEEWGGKVAPTEVAFPIVSHKMPQL